MCYEIERILAETITGKALGKLRNLKHSVICLINVWILFWCYDTSTERCCSLSIILSDAVNDSSNCQVVRYLSICSQSLVCRYRMYLNLVFICREVLISCRHAFHTNNFFFLPYSHCEIWNFLQYFVTIILVAPLGLYGTLYYITVTSFSSSTFLSVWVYEYLL